MVDPHNDSCPVEWLEAADRADKADKAEYDASWQRPVCDTCHQPMDDPEKCQNSGCAARGRKV